MGRLTSRSLLLVLVASITLAALATPRFPAGSRGNPNSHGHGNRQDRNKNGEYNADIAGYARGSAHASVDDSTVSISGTVKVDGRGVGQFTATDLTIDGPYFSGKGTLLGEKMNVRGRLDAVRASRLTATFLTASGHAGRIVGSLPPSVDTGDDQWDHD